MNIDLAECPICKFGLTSWADNQNGEWVCDTCGFGKNSDEYNLLQKLILFRKQYFKHSFMKSLEYNYRTKSSTT